MPQPKWIATTQAIAQKLGCTPRRVQQLIRELEIKPVQWIGKNQILSDADVRRLESRRTQRGPVKGNGKRKKEKTNNVK